MKHSLKPPKYLRWENEKYVQTHLFLPPIEIQPPPANEQNHQIDYDKACQNAQISPSVAEL